MKAWLGIAVPMLLVSLAWADVYKWVDENGVVHFSDSPPESTKSESIEPQKLELPSPAETQSAPDGEGVYDRAIEDTRAWLEKHNENRARTREEREAREKAELTSAENCAKAIHRLNILKKQCPVFYDSAGYLRDQCPGIYYSYAGERTYIDDKERAELVAHYEKIVAMCREVND